DLAALLARVNGALDAWHSSDLLSLAEELRDLAHVLLGDLRVLAEAALALRRLLFQQVALRSAAAQQLARRRHLEPFLRSAVCLLLWHRLWSLPRSSSARAASPCFASRPSEAATRSARPPSRPRRAA